MCILHSFAHLRIKHTRQSQKNTIYANFSAPQWWKIRRRLFKRQVRTIFLQILNYAAIAKTRNLHKFLCAAMAENTPSLLVDGKCEQFSCRFGITDNRKNAQPTQILVRLNYKNAVAFGGRQPDIERNKYNEDFNKKRTCYRPCQQH